ncbi:MAG: zinc ABC transporter substrate-binding protein [Ruminiclostridium sp.]|nr:zinc ABC transporter substrate-binding protein [Ruminiclostridium sp.]
MLKKLFIAVLLTFTLILNFSACGTKQAGSTVSSGEIKVVATLFPQYDFVRQIAGDKANVSLLLPPGVESHAFEPSPKDIVEIRKSGMFVYTGKYMEPWVDRIIKGTSGSGVVIVDASAGIELIDENQQEEEDSGEESYVGKDPHIWLDPVNAIRMVENIVEGLVQADPKGESFYRKNAGIYEKKLWELDRKFSETFSKVKSKKIIYGGHFAFGYFAKRYGLDYISPYKGFAPDAEPNPQRIAELVRNMEESGTKFIFFEELVEPKVAKVIAGETGAGMLLLHGAHNISRDELNEGITYIEIMEGNMERLKQGLGYGE